MTQTPEIAIIMGSDSDLPTMQDAISCCEEFGIATHVEIISAHRTPHAYGGVCADGS